MIFIRLFSFFTLLFICAASPVRAWLLETPQQSKQPAVIYLDGPSTSPAALYVQAVLEAAYRQLGYQIEYVKLPLGRGYIEANLGHIDGLRARVASAVENYPNLIQVPVPLMEFDLVMISDQRRCGSCNVQSVGHVATTRGLATFEAFRASEGSHLNVEYVTSPTQAFQMVLAGKVEGAVIAEVNLPEEFNTLQSHWIKNTLLKVSAYHFVHKKHQALVIDLQKQLLNMKNAGSFARLGGHFGVKGIVTNNQAENFENMSTTEPYQTNPSDTD